MKIVKFLRNPIRSLLVIATILGFFLLSTIVLPGFSELKQPQFAAVLDEAWKTVNENFFDPKFNGLDWKATQKKYQPLAKKAKSTEELATVINRMLAELKTSHTQFYTQQQPSYYQLLGIFGTDGFGQKFKKFFPDGNINYPGIGIFTKNIGNSTFVSGILDGSPAAKSELKIGDRILNIDGNSYQPIQSFAGKEGKEVKVAIQRTSDEKSVQTITVIPQQLDPKKMFLEGMRQSIEIIKRGDRQIGYIHIWSYAGQQYQSFLVDELAFGKLKSADALILDLRDGWGGASPSYLNVFTGKVPTLTRILRDGNKSDLDYQWKKPVVMLVNQGSRSGKEILAYGFQQYQIGPVIGTKTAAAVVGGSPFLLSDGSLLYLAVVDIKVNGDRLEGKGVTPDIEVPFSLPYAQGADPQKEKAIEVLAAKEN
jgi:carboxyl-terminal processing protease